MRKLMAFVAAVVAMGAFAEDWVYPGTKGDTATREVTVPGGWTLSCYATKSGGKLNVNKIVGFPDEPAVLDLSGTFVDSKGAELILGEVWEDASNKISHGGRRRYLLGDQLDSVMNYPFACAILAFVRYGVAERFMEAVVTVCENYPKPALDCLMNHIGTHDTARILSRIADYEIEDKPRRALAKHKIAADELPRACALLKTAATLQYTLPGFPSLYYGDEAGMQGYKDPFNRGCYPWGNEDTELIEYVSELSRVRKSVPNMKDGKIYFMSSEGIADDRLVAFTRTGFTCEKDCLVIINRSGDEVNIQNFSSRFNLFTDFEPLYGKFENDTAVIPPYGYTLVSAKFIK